MMGFIVPAVIIVALYFYNGQGNAVPARPAMVDGIADVFCAHPPEEGLLAPQIKTGGDLTLRIRNTSLQDAVVKIRDGTSAVVASAFLKRDGNIDITGLPSDDYKIQFQLGYRLDPTCKGFSTADVFEKSDPGKPLVFDGRKIIEYKLVAFGSANRRLFRSEFLAP
ncbi:hypothetical protein [Pleomorphomonas sp. NRK KF1]|uniref:hypothetical protein n=1 Tax=Pleomorphomonas sp. NRK KF1 TaxID=2943000 RepID=UPI002044024D|nr:hypothetical protein [Pleomorphomonas sp. NRK KF1]MCM5555264.1 hypothetical protein [Pleomorphomonas sp. NRK KF1]